MKRLILILTLCLFNNILVAASDDMVEYSSVGPWSIRIDSTIGNGCFLMASFEGDSVLRLGVNKNEGTIYLLVGDGNWESIEYGKEYEVKLKFGDEDAWTGDAEGFSFDPPENQPYLWIDLDANSESAPVFVLEFMQEDGFQVFYNDTSIIHLSLRDSYKAGLELMNCQESVDSRKADPFLKTPSKSDSFSDVAPETSEQSALPDEEGTTPLSFGTCFFVDGLGTAVTSNHVIEGHDSIEVITSDGSKSTAKVIKSSGSIDTAILSTGHMTPNYLSLAKNRSLTLGQDVFTIGYPATNILGDAPKYTEGTISSLSGLNNDDSWIQMSTPIQPGNSGGPLVNEEGQVVGIVAATAAVENFFSITGSLPQNVNWAVKAEYTRPLIPNVSENVQFDNKRAAISHVEKSICRVVVH